MLHGQLPPGARLSRDAEPKLGLAAAAAGDAAGQRGSDCVGSVGCAMVTFNVPGQPQGKGRGSLSKATDAEITRVYTLTGSCKKVAEILGMCAQSVHERLVRMGINKTVNQFSDLDRARLMADYTRHADSGTLSALAKEMGRTKEFICRQAKAMGLTSQCRPRPYASEKCSINAKANIAANGHPRGMKGKKHSPETKAQIAVKSAAQWAGMSSDRKAEVTLNQLKGRAAAGGLARARPETTWKAGWREVGGKRIYFRSRWEANYGCYLEWLKSTGHIAAWEHEPDVFWFEKIKRGCRSYLPDFKVTENGGAVAYHEVKGWMDDRSKTKIKRMRIYHPKVLLIVIDSKQYEEIRRKVSSLVPGWES
jgi:hypothetical protein